jgi:hypothetical protein
MRKDDCRTTLATSLRQLQKRVEVLQTAVEGDCAPLGFFAIIRTSEDVRISTLRALSDQYRRSAANAEDRLLPKELPIFKPRPRASLRLSGDALAPVDLNFSQYSQQFNRASSPRKSCFLTLPMETIIDGIATPVSAGSRRSMFLSEPPSPPLTPTKVDDLASIRSRRSSVSSRSMRTSDSMEVKSRPVTGVFSLFCPEAMRYQLDPARKVSNRLCKCGHDFTPQQISKQPSIHLMDGFQMTPRFLAKSHHVGAGFGCVLCISNGKIGSYEGVAALGNHLSTHHDKWQMLHDRDLAVH